METNIQKLAIRANRKIHGDTTHTTKSKEYQAWIGMKSRCFNVNEKRYKNYGGRGITVCDRWRDSYQNFLTDMGRAPSPKHSIDRINVDGNYEPTNCRWASIKEQANNTTRCLLIRYNGKVKTLKEWCSELGLKYNRINYRIRAGWPVIEAFHCIKTLGKSQRSMQPKQ